MHRSDVLRGRGQPGSNRPNRLIGDDQCSRGRAEGDRAVELRRHDFDGVSGLTLLSGFTDAKNRRQTRPPCGGDLVANLGVGLPMAVPPLGMSKNHIAAAEISQHFGAYVAGVGAFWRGMAVLPSETDPASGENAADFGKERRRRTDEDLAPLRLTYRGSPLFERM